jgi:hypothetical protein
MSAASNLTGASSWADGDHQRQPASSNLQHKEPSISCTPGVPSQCLASSYRAIDVSVHAANTWSPLKGEGRRFQTKVDLRHAATLCRIMRLPKSTFPEPTGPKPVGRPCREFVEGPSAARIIKLTVSRSGLCDHKCGAPSGAVVFQKGSRKRRR